jgi:V8-like Glu-specific endopeptidase
MMLAVVLLLFTSIGFSQTTHICGVDDRVATQDPKIGRIRFPGVRGAICTATMIGKSCAISAGHCIRHMRLLEFNVPSSIAGEPQPSDPADTYVIDQASIRGYDIKERGDWAVFRVAPNARTKLLPGEISGFYKLNFAEPSVGEEITITGYGLDARDDRSTLTQQMHYGPIQSLKRFFKGEMMGYRIDAPGGSSGSAILRAKERDIIGVHVAGGCWGDLGYNVGIVLAKHPEFIRAIEACLADD